MFRSPPSLFLSMLLVRSLCMNGEWSVTYSPAQYICVLRGSSIIMQCRYSHPRDLRVKDVRWVNQDTENPVDFSTDGNYSDRVVTASGDKTCFMLLTNVSAADALQRYQCQITNEDTESYIGEPGISLSVTDLQIVVSIGKNIVNRDFVTFTCATTCDLPGILSYLWIKDGRLLEGETEKQMVLEPVYLDNYVGTYSCAVRGYGNIPIPSAELKIQTHVISSDGKPLNTGETSGMAILMIVVFGLMIGLRFLQFYYCLRSPQTPQPATMRVTVLPVVTPARVPNFQAWRNLDGKEPLIS